MNLFKSKLQPLRTDRPNKFASVVHRVIKEANETSGQTQNNMVTDRFLIQKEQATEQIESARLRQGLTQPQINTRNQEDWQINGNHHINYINHQDSQRTTQIQNGTFIRVESITNKDSVKNNPYNSSVNKNASFRMTPTGGIFGKFRSIAVSSLHSDDKQQAFQAKGRFQESSFHQHRDLILPISQMDESTSQNNIDFRQFRNQMTNQNSFKFQISEINRQKQMMQTPTIRPRKLTVNDRFYLGSNAIQPQTPLNPRIGGSISPNKFSQRKQTMTSQGSGRVLSNNKFPQRGDQQQKLSYYANGRVNSSLKQSLHLNPQGYNQAIMSESQSENESKLVSSIKKLEVNKYIKDFQSFLKDTKKEAKLKKKEKEKIQDHSEMQNELGIKNKKSIDEPASGLPKLDKSKTSQISGADGFLAGLKRQKALSRTLSIFTQQKQGSTQTQEDSDEEMEDPLKRIERTLKKSPYTIYPDQKFKTIWDVFSCILILHWAMMIPLQYSFSEFNPRYLQYTDPLQELWFIIDLFLNFNTGYFYKGIIVMERRLIINQYLKSWFFIDFIGFIPYSFIISNLQDSEFYSMSPLAIENSNDLIIVLQNLRLLRLLRIIKISKLLQHIQDQISTELMNSFYRLFKTMILIIISAHWLACLFYAVADSIKYKTDSWISNGNLQDATIEEKYVNALYWTITTMATVGYGDLKIQTTEERGTVILIMVISGAIYAYTINDIGHIVQRYNQLANQYKEKMTYVNQFLIQKQLPTELRQKINNYLSYNWEQKKKIKIEESEFMSLLNEDLRDKITIYLNGQMLNRIRCLNDFKIDFKSQLTFFLTNKSFSTEENIIVENDFGDEIFYLTSGKVAVMHRATQTYICDLKKDDYFGEISFFADCQRTCTIRSRDFTDALTIKKQAFFDIAWQFPEAIDMYYMIHDRISVQEKSFAPLKLSCYLCSHKNHISVHCSKFKHLQGNMQNLYWLKQKQLRRKVAKGFWNNQSTAQEYQEEDEYYQRQSYFLQPHPLVPQTSIESIERFRQKGKGKRSTFRSFQTSNRRKKGLANKKGTNKHNESFGTDFLSEKEAEDNENRLVNMEEEKEEILEEEEADFSDMLKLVHQNLDKTELMDGTLGQTFILDNEINIEQNQVSRDYQGTEEYDEEDVFQFNHEPIHMQLQNGHQPYLEDIKEDAYDEDEVEETKYPKTPLIQDSSMLLSSFGKNAQLMRTSADRVFPLSLHQQNSSKLNLLKNRSTISQVQPRHLTSNTPKKLSHIQTKSQNTTQKQDTQEQHVIQIYDTILDKQSAAQISRKSIDDDSAEELLQEDLADTNKNSSLTNENRAKIRPFRGIIRNALQRKMRLKTGKYFQEDSLEDLANQIYQEVVVHPEVMTPLLKKKYLSYKKTLEEKPSLHTLISSRSSLDPSNLNPNSMNLLKKILNFKRQSTKQFKQNRSKFSVEHEKSAQKLKLKQRNSAQHIEQPQPQCSDFEKFQESEESSQIREQNVNAGIYQPIIKVENNSQNIVFNFQNGGSYQILYTHQDQSIPNSSRMADQPHISVSPSSTVKYERSLKEHNTDVFTTGAQKTLNKNIFAQKSNSFNIKSQGGITVELLGVQNKPNLQQKAPNPQIKEQPKLQKSGVQQTIVPTPLNGFQMIGGFNFAPIQGMAQPQIIVQRQLRPQAREAATTPHVKKESFKNVQ